VAARLILPELTPRACWPGPTRPRCTRPDVWTLQLRRRARRPAAQPGLWRRARRLRQGTRTWWRCMRRRRWPSRKISGAIPFCRSTGGHRSVQSDRQDRANRL